MDLASLQNLGQVKTWKWTKQIHTVTVTEFSTITLDCVISSDIIKQNRSLFHWFQLWCLHTSLFSTLL